VDLCAGKILLMCLSFPYAFTLSIALIIIGELRVSSASEPMIASQEAVTATLSVDQAKMHPSYRLFVAQTRLPDMKAFDRVLIVGGALKINLGKPVTIDERLALSELLQVPPGFLAAIIPKLATNQQLKGEKLASEFQTAVIDYRYLNERWTRYRPEPSRELIKTEALRCLQAGDLERAWQMFVELPRPAPPTGLRIINTNAPAAGQ
jgi:hypothetical protein